MKPLISVAALFCLLASNAHAANKAAAKAAYEEGTKLYEVENFQGALEAFKKAYVNYADSSFLFNIGQCYRQLDNKTEAVHFYRTYLSKASDAPNTDEVKHLIETLEAAIAQDKASTGAQPTGTLPPGENQQGQNPQQQYPQQPYPQQPQTGYQQPQNDYQPPPPQYPQQPQTGYQQPQQPYPDNGYAPPPENPEMQNVAVEQQALPPPDAPNQAVYGYFGQHPIPYEAGSGFCAEEGAHFHEYPPFDTHLFRQANGYFYFVGGVDDFGYAGRAWGYRGNHPIPVEYGGGWCYIDWEHRHFYAPPAGVVYTFGNGFYVYGGVFDPIYYARRDFYVGYYKNYYRRNYFGGAYYRVRPPAVYRGSLRAGERGFYRSGVTVKAPNGTRVSVVRAAPPPRAAAPYRGAPNNYARPNEPYRAGQPYHPAQPAYHPGETRPNYPAQAHPGETRPVYQPAQAHPGETRPAYQPAQAHPAYPAPAQTRPAYQAPTQTARPAYQAPAQTSRPAPPPPARPAPTRAAPPPPHKH